MEETPRTGRIARTVPLFGLAGRTVGTALASAFRRGGITDFHARNAEHYARRLGLSKGVLMKAGQILSFVDVAGSEYAPVYQAAFARLQDSAPPMSHDTLAGVVEEELGMPPDELFAEFDREPLAAASIGQVHAATLPDGTRVAVKVQYPGIGEAIRADLANTELLAGLMRVFQAVVPGMTGLDPRALAAEITERIGDELDYGIEAGYQREFWSHYRGHPFIRVPQVLPELSSARVLTTELSTGRRYKDALEAGASLRDRWGEAIYRFSLSGMRTIGLFNADPHPGNYLFHDDGSVTFLDFGCVKRFDRDRVATIQELLTATVEGDADRVLAALAAGGFVKPDDAPPAADLFAWFASSLRPLLEPQPFTYTEEYAAEVVRAQFNPFGPHSSVVRKTTPTRDFLFLTRIDLGMTAVLGRLGATGEWRAIRAEWDLGAPPATPYGELEARWRAEGACPTYQPVGNVGSPGAGRSV